MTNLELQKTANEVRKGIVSGVHAAKAGHPGGSLSAADIYTYLYFEALCSRRATRRRDCTRRSQTADISRWKIC